MTENSPEYDYREFRTLLLEGDYDKCLEYVNSILNKDVDIREIYDEVLKKSLYSIGEMWEENKITVATEHLASAIVEAILSEVYFKIISGNKTTKTAIVTCTENEFHQIGSKMVSDVFEMNGWNVNFLGSGTRTEELISLIESVKPDILAISLSVPFNFPTLEKMLVKIGACFPDLFILVGGQAFLHIGPENLKKFRRVIYKPDLKSLQDFLQNKSDKIIHN